MVRLVVVSLCAPLAKGDLSRKTVQVFAFARAIVKTWALAIASLVEETGNQQN